MTKSEKRKKVQSYIFKKSKVAEHQASPEVTKKKRKLQNACIPDETRFIDTLTQNEESNGRSKSNDGTYINTHKNPNEHTIFGNEMVFGETMNLEEVHNHIQKCIEMSSENKITPKNAFALNLIDCMNLLLQKEDFSVMACTLDAGQKIYAYRVDGLHQQVTKLAGEIIYNHKNKKADNREDEEGCGESLKKDSRKVSKRNVLASAESLRRTLKGKDPKEKFIKVDGLPGAIISSVKRDPKDLSFTLENGVQFWHDYQNYKPTGLLSVGGTVTIPQCEIYRDSNISRKMENLLKFSPQNEHEKTVEADTLNVSDVESSEENAMDESNDTTVEDYSKSIEEVDVITQALNSLNREEDKNENICTVVSRLDAMKMIFNKASDYHYLNMEKAYYWAGPEFWKRSKIRSSDCNEKKKVSRKKKDPSEISYTGPVAEEMIGKILKKGSRLNKKTIMGWKMKHVTYAKDLKIGINQVLNLFNMSEFFEPEEILQSSDIENEIFDSQNLNSRDVLQDVTDYPSSQDPLNSSFYESAPENSSPEYTDHLNSAFYDGGLAWKSGTSSTEAGKVLKVHFSGTHNSDTTLVPAPKMVNFQPIKYKTKPIRVDMHHLKEKMWEVINENTNNINEHNDETKSEDLPETTFSDVLKQLPSRLEKRTGEDLFPGMGFLALLTLATENNLKLRNTDGYSDVLISHESPKLTDQ